MMMMMMKMMVMTKVMDDNKHDEHEDLYRH